MLTLQRKATRGLHASPDRGHSRATCRRCQSNGITDLPQICNDFPIDCLCPKPPSRETRRSPRKKRASYNAWLLKSRMRGATHTRSRRIKTVSDRSPTEPLREPSNRSDPLRTVHKRPTHLLDTSKSNLSFAHLQERKRHESLARKPREGT